MMKFIFGLFMALALSLPLATPVAAAPTDPAIFFIPHQDDDVLSFGADMKNHVLAGRRVIAVLLTDGSSSGICKQRYSNADGSYDDAGRALCTAERDTEFLNAMNTLGVEPVILADRQQDGSLTKAYVTSVMESFLAQYPNASFKAQTYRESQFCTPCNNGTTGPGHPDHDKVGNALRDLAGTTDKRFYIKTELWEYFPNLGRFVTRQDINSALDAYAGFGQVSVPHAFHEQYHNAGYTKADGYYNSGGADSKYHLPGE